MKQMGIFVGVILGSAAFAQNPPTPQRDGVLDSATAVSIARAAAIKVYGKRQIEYEEPLTASVKHGVWSVYGTLCCPDRNGKRVCKIDRCAGGVVEIRIRQSDGQILSMTHGK
jgi:hypothetical protein